MSALFLGEILYLFLHNGRLGLIICNILLLFLMTTLTGVVFKVHRESRQMYFGIIMCLIMGFCVNIGYHICSSYSDNISGMEKRYEDNTKLSVKGRIIRIEEKSNSIYCYVKHASVSDGKSDMKVRQVLLIIKKHDTGTNTGNNSGKKERGNVGKEQLAHGNYIYASTSYHVFECARNDGGFDERKYYYSIGVSGKCVVTNYEVKSSKQIYDCILKALYKFKRSMCARINLLSERHYAGIYEGILFGEKSAVPADARELYKLAGISHMLSISGLHISLIGYFVYRWLRKCRGITFSAVVSVVIICLYAMMAGCGFSTKRAVIMFGVNILADILGRTYDLISALSLSFIIIMLTNPFCIFNSGFLLSFAAILGINPLYGVVIDSLGTQKKWVKSLAAGICINIVTRPVIMNAYNEISIYSSLINLFIVSLMSIMVSCGFAGIIISYIWFDLGKIIFLAGCRILEFYEFLCRKFLELPNSVMIVKSPGTMQIVIYYLLIIFIILVLAAINRKYLPEEGKPDKAVTENHREKCRINYIIAAVVNVMLFVILTYGGNDKLEVKMVDVGQGDSIYINIKGKNILIDAGSSSERNITKYTILPFLKANGVKQLDYLIMTHSDDDHAGGMAELINEQYNGDNYVKNLILPDIGDNVMDTLYKEIESIADKNNVNIIYFSSGCHMKCEDAELKCIWPDKGADKPDKNNLSIVLKLESDNFNMLFTGDLSKAGEKEILSRLESSGIRLDDVDVLKVGHHGSDGSGCSEFVKAIKPKVSMISCGINNPYGHPGKQAVKRLKEAGSEIFITPETGQITIIKKDKGFYVETFLH